MLTLEIKEIELDYCADDMGVWFDEGEIEALLESTTPVLTADPKDARGSRRCPRCNARMLLHFPVPELELDVCPNGDGVWFDAGEVEHLATAMKDKKGLEQDAHLDEIFMKLNNMLIDFGLPIILDAFGVDSREKRTALASEVNVERLENNPRRLDEQDVIDIYEAIA